MLMCWFYVSLTQATVIMEKRHSIFSFEAHLASSPPSLLPGLQEHKQPGLQGPVTRNWGPERALLSLYCFC